MIKLETEVLHFAPSDEQTAVEILQECYAQKRTVRIIGGNTKADLGGWYTPTASTLSTLQLADLLEYHPEDLTVTVGAGMEFARLQEILAQQSQFLALDPPPLPGQTIGGALAANQSGPRRLLYGTARDLLIGCRYVLADGTFAHSGGKVVKNVAGYDLHKLFIGAFGTLGLLTEVTFKVTPLPAVSQLAHAQFSNLVEALAAARSCVRSNLLPAFLEIDNAGQLFFGAEGVEVAVTAQLEKLAEICRVAGATGLEIESPVASSAWLNRLAEPPKENTLVRVGTLLTELPKFAKELKQLAAELQISHTLQIRAGNGLLYAGFELPESLHQEFAGKLQTLRAGLHKQNGYLVVEKASNALKKNLNVWGDFGSALLPMQNLKNKLDPARLLNPGVMDLF